MNAEWNGQFILSCDSGKNSQRIEYMSIGEMSISNISDSVRDGVVFVCLFVCVCVCVCVCVLGGEGVEAGDLMGRGCQSRQTPPGVSPISCLCRDQLISFDLALRFLIYRWLAAGSLSTEFHRFRGSLITSMAEQETLTHLKTQPGPC